MGEQRNRLASAPSDHELQGTVGSKLKSYGWIWYEGTDRDEVFFHQSATTDWDDLEPGDRVTFKILVRGSKTRAVKVRKIEGGDDDE